MEMKKTEVGTVGKIEVRTNFLHPGKTHLFVGRLQNVVQISSQP